MPERSFLHRFDRKCSIWEFKVQASKGQLSGRVPLPTPSSVRHVLNPPVAVSPTIASLRTSPLINECCKRLQGWHSNAAWERTNRAALLLPPIRCFLLLPSPDSYLHMHAACISWGALCENTPEPSSLARPHTHTLSDPTEIPPPIAR